MTKIEWDAIEARQKDGLVLTILWKAENGEPIDIHWNDDPEMNDCYPEYIPSGKPWRTHSIDAVDVPRFTTDRNACALVLDEIERRGEIAKFITQLGRAIDGLLVSWRILRADPDTICYAAVRVVEKRE